MTLSYLEKYALFPRLNALPPPANLGMVITIPCFAEGGLMRTLNSLKNSLPPYDSVEVIVVVNHSVAATEAEKALNAGIYEQALQWAKEQIEARLAFYIYFFPDLEAKHAGVGLARKIAMDEAVRRFEWLGKDGIIVCLDADTVVQPDYFRAIEDYFVENPTVAAAGINFEHPTTGQEFSREIYEAIIRYELHLRYYVLALRRAGLVTSYQTIGSAMAVRSRAYQAEGGMNRRKAGEDFYFLHKFTPKDKFGEIKTTVVIPSPRISHRVPFGTGKAVGDMVSGKEFLTYSPLIFRDLEVFLQLVEPMRHWSVQSANDQIGQLPDCVATFLWKVGFVEKLQEIQQNTHSDAAFRKRFFQWFDPFLAMKYVHHARDHFYPGEKVAFAAAVWLESEKLLQFSSNHLPTELELLEIFREID